MQQTYTTEQPQVNDTTKKRYTLREVQLIAQPYGLLVQSLNSNTRAPYGIYFDNQLIAQANKLTQVVEALPALYRAINEQLAHNTQPETIPSEIQVLEQHGDEYITYNPQNNNHYVVRPNHPEERQRCECPHTYYRGAKCKHQQAVEKHLSLTQATSSASTPPLSPLSPLSPCIETTLEQTEVDAIPDQDFGILCRLWHGTTLLGTFYRQIFTDNWIATPADSIHPYHCPNEDDARYWLVAHHLNAATPMTAAKSVVAV